jgi:hypothetical protein
MRRIGELFTGGLPNSGEISEIVRTVLLDQKLYVFCLATCLFTPAKITLRRGLFYITQSENRHTKLNRECLAIKRP